MADVDPSNRKAYLEEQIERQKRGEPIDVDWVKDELQRVRGEQNARLQASQRNMRFLVIAASLLMVVLWARKGATLDRGSFIMLGLVVIGLLVVFALRGRRKT